MIAKENFVYAVGSLWWHRCTVGRKSIQLNQILFIDEEIIYRKAGIKSYKSFLECKSHDCNIESNFQPIFEWKSSIVSFDKNFKREELACQIENKLFCIPAISYIEILF